MKTINIITKAVGAEMQEVTIEHSLENMQKLVGGYIDVVRFPYKVDMYVNDEGLLEGLAPNIVGYELKNGKPDIKVHWVGGVFFASVDDEGETISLNDMQKAWIRKNFNEDFVSFYTNEAGEKMSYSVWGFELK